MRGAQGNLRSYRDQKSRMPQIQGAEGDKLLRTFGNVGDEVASAFPKGKQRTEKNVLLQDFTLDDCQGKPSNWAKYRPR
ncbi:hypothetical protein C6A37_01530 [Desulfobacteraceae bacterium SEEP-SAG9]|nr:hypothetical protein C6A37_01530 [Desulfobacteraceae bacterium SEEP-SAG9]